MDRESRRQIIIGLWYDALALVLSGRPRVRLKIDDMPEQFKIAAELPPDVVVVHAGYRQDSHRVTFLLDHESFPVSNGASTAWHVETVLVPSEPERRKIARQVILESEV